MKTYFLLFFIIIGQAFGQSLEGRVTDEVSGEPIQGAIIFISYNYMDYTDSEGFYNINGIPAGDYNLKISHLSYKTISSDQRIDEHNSRKNFQLIPSPIKLDEVIVSTDRMGNYLRNSAYSELLVGKDEIEEKPFQSIPDALKYEPGISLLRDGIWGTEVNIRGLSRENVITLIDGNRIVTSTDIAARLSMVNLNDIERIEIIKGASSSIYGSGATGGIINIVTKSPEFNNRYYFDGSFSGGYNSVNNSTVTSGIFYSGSSFWSAKLAASYRDAANTQTPAGELRNSQFEDYSLSGTLNLKTFENHKLKFDYQLFKAEDVGIPGASVFPGTATVRYPDEKREMISGTYEIQNISRLLYKLSARYAYQYIERNVENIPHIIRNVAATDSTPARRINVLKITPGAEHRSNNVDVQGNMLLSENNNLIFGLDYWDRKYSGHRENYQLIEVLNSSGNVVAVNNRIIGEKPLPDAESRNIGIYLQDEAGLIKNKLSLTLGARADKIYITGERTLNPVYEIVNGVMNSIPAGQQVIWDDIKTNTSSYSSNLGLKYSLNSNLDLTLSLGFSFRSPSLEERFQYIDQGSFIRIGNPELKSEKGRAADLGIRFYLPELKIISSIFFNYFTDLVIEEPGTFEGRSAFIKTNVGQARLYGFDLSTEYNFYNDFILFSTVSYVKGDDVTFNKNLPAIPPLNANFGFKKGIFNKLEAEISSNIFAAQNDVAAGELNTPGYAAFNLSLKTMPFNLSLLKLQIFTGVENLFDKSYRDHLSTTRGNITLEPGRNIYLRLSANW